MIGAQRPPASPLPDKGMESGGAAVPAPPARPSRGLLLLLQWRAATASEDKGCGGAPARPASGALLDLVGVSQPCVGWAEAGPATLPPSCAPPTPHTSECMALPPAACGVVDAGPWSCLVGVAVAATEGLPGGAVAAAPSLLWLVDIVAPVAASGAVAGLGMLWREGSLLVGLLVLLGSA